jgi:uncharacterized membrane protein YkvA (DUF1232 family)
MNEQKKSRIFERARKAAEETIRDPEKIRNIIDTAVHMAGSAGTASPFHELTGKFQALVRLVRAYINKEYRVIPWQSVVLAVAALIYFVNPLDAIPDFIPLIGLLDDTAIFTAVLASINHDLTKFMEWEKLAAQSSGEPIPRVVDAEFEEVSQETADNG